MLDKAPISPNGKKKSIMFYFVPVCMYMHLLRAGKYSTYLVAWWCRVRPIHPSIHPIRSSLPSPPGWNHTYTDRILQFRGLHPAEYTWRYCTLQLPGFPWGIDFVTIHFGRGEEGRGWGSTMTSKHLTENKYLEGWTWNLRKGYQNNSLLSDTKKNPFVTHLPRSLPWMAKALSALGR